MRNEHFNRFFFLFKFSKGNERTRLNFISEAMFISLFRFDLFFRIQKMAPKNLQKNKIRDNKKNLGNIRNTISTCFDCTKFVILNW